MSSEAQACVKPPLMTGGDGASQRPIARRSRRSKTYWQTPFLQTPLSQLADEVQLCMGKKSQSR